VHRGVDDLLPQLEPLERASGFVVGSRRSQLPLGAALEPASGPREALEQLILGALRRQPCLVAFSGGRDSSAILGVAVETARRHGLADPIPVTLRFGGDDRTGEQEWQELVVRHLAVAEWIRLDLTTELDALGPLGAGLLVRHGAYWPPLAHSTVPMLQAAKHGSLLTGNGGDELLTPWSLRRLWLLRRARTRPRPADMKWLVFFSLPNAARAEVYRRRSPIRLGWLTPDADRELQRSWARQSVAAQSTWAEYVDWMLGSRYFELGRAIFAAFARDAGVLLVEPFLEPRVAHAVVQEAPPAGFASRSEAVERLFGDLLPPQLTARTTKATFTTVPWGPAARAFAADWDGSGLDPDLVDADALRAEWLRERPDFRSLTPLQCVWLAAQKQ
jgi:asparagine synthase (glutamine-hydrolysing)